MLGHGPISSTPICALHEWRAYVYSYAVLTASESLFNTLYPSTREFVTKSSDSPASQPFYATLDASLRVERSIAGGLGYSGYVQNVSEFSLINADGAYDVDIDENSINGQAIVVRVGVVPSGNAGTWAYSEFETVANLIGERWRADRSRVTAEVSDYQRKLDVPVQAGSYAGTGELEGGTELAGKRRPYGDGEVYNATPTLVIATEGLWQYNAGAVTSVEAVKDGGIELNFVADYATVALLRAANTALLIPPGSYATCIAEGYFCIGGAAFAQVTVDFTGLNSTSADIIEAVALAAGGLSAADLETWTFGKLNADQPAAVGYYLGSDSSETCAEMFAKLMGGIGGWAGFSVLGKLQLMRMEAPVPIAAEYYDTDGGNLISIDRTALPQSVDPPPRRRRVVYARNWTIMSTIYGQVSEEDPALADYLTKPYKLASTSEAEANAILADYPFAPDPDPVESYFVDEDDAQDEAERLLVLYASGYEPYRAQVANALFTHEIGQVAKFTDNRLGLSGGKYLRIVEIADDAKTGITELVGFG